MGAAESVGSELKDATGAEFHRERIFATNSGKCVEDRYPEGAVCLHLGSGRCRWAGWIGVDLNAKFADVVADIRSLPYPDNHADAMAAIHVVEHINRWEVENMLSEWLRVLKPNGVLILELPSMEKVFRYISDCHDQRKPLSYAFSWFPLWGDPKYKDEGMTHRWGYTFPMLRELLIKAGFTGVKVDKPRYHFPQRDMRITAAKPSTT